MALPQDPTPQSYARFCKSWRTRIKDRFVHPKAEEYWPQCLRVDAFSRDQLLELQNQRLQSLVGQVIQHVPFYRCWAKEKGISPGDVVQLQDLPIITKADYRRDIDAFQSDLYPVSKMSDSATSGTTGEPFTFRSYPGEKEYSYCCLWRGLRRFGLRPGDRRVLVWGHAPSSNQPKLRMLIKSLRRQTRDWMNNTVFFFADVLDDKSAAGAIRQIRDAKPMYLHGYVTAFYVLARWALDSGEDLRDLHLKAVITESEKLYDFQKETIAKAFCCPVVEHYGSLEYGMIAQRDPQGFMRIHEDRCIVESLPGGEAVITNLDAYAFPFLRYKLGDLVELDEKVATGLPYKSIKTLVGRVADLVPIPRGGYIHGFLLHYPFEQFMDQILRYQVHQTRIDHFIVRWVLSAAVPETTRAKITSAFRDAVGEEVTIEFQQVASLPNTTSGKFRWVISDVSDVAKRMLQEQGSLK